MRNNLFSFCPYVSNSRLKISSIVHDCPPRRAFTSLELSRGHDVLHFNQALTLMLWFGVLNTCNTELRIYLAGKEQLWLDLLHFISMKIWKVGGGWDGEGRSGGQWRSAARLTLSWSLSHAQHHECKSDYAVSSSRPGGLLSFAL